MLGGSSKQWRALGGCLWGSHTVERCLGTHCLEQHGFSQNFVQFLQRPVLWEHRNRGWFIRSVSAYFRLLPAPSWSSSVGWFSVTGSLLQVPQPHPWRDSPLPPKASLEISLTLPLPCPICWPVRGFFSLQLIFGRMIEFVGTCHISFGDVVRF